VEWVTRDVGRIFPREWERFASAVPDALQDLPLVDAYATLLSDPDPAVRERAAREWCAWEDAHVSLAPGHRPNPRYQDPDFRLRFARLVTHYWRNAAFLENDQLLRDAPTQGHPRFPHPRPVRRQQPARNALAHLAAVENEQAARSRSRAW
jgi:proline iminopeptidase